MRALAKVWPMVVVGVLALSMACGGGGGGGTTTPAPPTISSFIASPTTITAGETADLTGTFSNGTGVVTPGSFECSCGIPMAVTPTVTTTYTLTVTNSAGTVVTQTAMVTVTPLTNLPTITTQPASLTIQAGTDAGFTVAASGNPSPTISWERSNDGGTTWTPITGGTSTTCSFIAAKTDNQAQFRALATNSLGTATSNPATLTVQWLSITSQPAGQAVTQPNPATFTIAVDANPAPTYQWQYSAGTLTWTNCSGGTGTSYTTAATSASDSGTQFQCIVSNPAATITSDTAILTVNEPLVGPAFTTQPVNLTVNSGSSASFTVAASGNPSPTFTWARSNDSGNTWTPISSATSSTYSFTPQFVDNGAEFQATASNSQGSITSNPATLTVVPTVYAAGYSMNSSGYEVPGYWLNGNWVGLTPAEGSINGIVTAIIVSGSDVYAAGYSENGSSEAFTGYWLNSNWVGLTPPLGSNNSWVTSTFLSGSDVYVAGWCLNALNTPATGYWLDGNWVSLIPPSGSSNSQVSSIVVSGGDVYVGGGPNRGWNNTWIPGYWLNGVWIGLTPPNSGTVGGVAALAISGSDVYAAGFVLNSYGTAAPGYWLNGTWVALPPLYAPYESNIMGLVVSGGNVYAGGYSENSAGYGVAGYWFNGNWVGLPSLDSLHNSFVQSMAVLGDDVYAAGYSVNSSGVEVPGYWLNGTWTALTPLDSSYSAQVNSIVVQ